MFSFFVCYCLTRKVYYNSIVKIRKSTKSHVSASLKDLEKKGLVERIQSADNKKHIEINLLSKAEPIVEAGLKAQKQFAKNVLSGLSEEEKTVCISVFQKIYNNANEFLKKEKEREVLFSKTNPKVGILMIPKACAICGLLRWDFSFYYLKRKKASAIFCLADAFILELLNRFKIHGTVFAQRADDIFRKFISFIDISADFAHESFLAVCFRLRFYVLLVVGVGHSILIAHDAGFSDAADKHAVGAQINILLYFQ